MLSGFSAQKFSELYFSAEIHGSSHPALNVLNRLCQATENLLAPVSNTLLLFQGFNIIWIKEIQEW